MINSLKNLIRPTYNRIKEGQHKKMFLKSLTETKEKGGPIKVVIGSSGVFEDNWIPSEAHFLNLLDENTWLTYFKENEIDNLIAEHVWEHLTLEQGKKAAQVCAMFLKKGGTLRVAIPDGFHKDPDYIEYVKPGGHGAGADDHKVLYNYKTFSAIFEENGFKVELLEYFDENKEFVHNKWDNKNGFIRRSIENDERNKGGEPNYTSLMLDAIKL